MAKGRRSKANINKQKKIKKPKPYEVVTSVLKPPFHKTVVEQLITFFNQYHWDDFETIFQTLLKQPEVRANLNQYSKLDGFFNVEADVNIPIQRILDIYKVQLVNGAKEITRFEKLRQDVECLIINSEYECAKKELLAYKDECGESIWFISAYFNVLALNKEYEKINECVNEYYEANSETLFELILNRLYQKIKGADVLTIVEDTTVNMNREFMSGGATGFAAFCSLIFLPFPLYEDFETTESLELLQYFPLVDLYYYFTLLASHIGTRDSKYEKAYGEEFMLEFEKVLCALKNNIQSERLDSIHKLFFLNSKGSIHNYFDYNNDRCYLDYCMGNYRDVIDRFNDKKLYDTHDFIKFNLYARSYIYLNESPSNKLPNFVRGVLVKLIDIYLLNNVEKASSELLSIVVKHNDMEFSKYVLIALRNANNKVISEEQHKKLMSHVVYGATPMSFSFIPTILFNNCDFNLINEVTKLKFKIVDSINKSNLANKEKVLEELSEYESRSPIRKDFIELKSQYLLSINDFTSLLSFSASELISSSDCIVSIPLEEIASYIDKEAYYSTDSVVFSYFYNKIKDKKIDYLLNECFEEFIISKGFDRPSEYLYGLKQISDSEAFIFRNIANLNVIDYLGCFENTGDLSSERLKILELLKNLNAIDVKDYNEEYIQILDNYIIECGVTQLSHSKVVVNKAQFVSSNLSTAKSYMKSYSLANDNEENHVFEDKQSNKERVAYAKGAKNELAIALFEELTRGFLSNDEYGLDKTLSSEIRHSFFSNQICSSIQASNLMAELNVEGIYQSNSYWSNKYNYVNQSIMSDIESIISEFTQKVNGLIERAESWMRVGASASTTEKVFVFTTLSMQDFQSVKDELEKATSANSILELSYDILITHLTQKLEEMKKMLNEVFLGEIDELFKELSSNITEAKQGTSLTDLFVAIRKANEAVKDDIKIVCEWFSLKTSTIEESLPIDNVIKIAEKCFNGCFSADNSIDVLIKDNLLIEASHVNPLVFTIINTLHNATKYGVKKCKIYLDFAACQGGFKLTIKNIVTKQRLGELVNGGIAKLTDKLLTMNSSELLKVEGNSGLYKSAHKLKAVTAKYNVVPFLEGNKFCLRIENCD